jgi:hypothetical protein
MKDGRLICGVGPLVRRGISLPALTSSGPVSWLAENEADAAGCGPATARQVPAAAASSLAFMGTSEAPKSACWALIAAMPALLPTTA